MAEFTGDDGNNSITGTDEADTIRGLGGDDFLSGLGGNDLLEGGNGGDILSGGLGDDTLDGGAQGVGQADFADYRAATGPVVVDLAAGTASGADGNDVLIGIEGVFGSAFDDHFTGTGGNEFEFFRGGTGDDHVDGGDGFDISDYRNASGPMVIDLGAGSTSGPDGQDTLVNIEGIIGSEYGDTVQGSARDDWIRGRGGDDLIDGGGGFDRAIYDQAPSAVTVDLAAGTATGGDGDDTLISVENLRGSNFADLLSGDDGRNSIEARGGDDIVHGRGGDDNLRGEAGDDQLFGGDGDDVLAGGAGNDLLDGGGQRFFDIANYTGASAGVTADLATGTGGGTSEGTDTYVGIEGLLGSHFDDTLTGDAAQNYFRGNRGDDFIDGGGGTADDHTNNSVDFGDFTDYRDAAGPVTVNLAAGTATGADGSDTLIDIEHVFGSAHADTLTGDAGNNLLRGHGGDDLIDGGAGVDRADYRNATGSVTVSLNDDGSGSSSGADGIDTLLGIENLQGSELYGDALSGNAHTNWLRGLGGDDLIDGGGGVDTAGYDGQRADSTLALSDSGWTVASAAEGNDTLLNIERLEFTDISVALDLSGNAGTVAKILGAVFGKEAVANAEYAGIGLYYLDGGMSYETLVQLAIDARLGAGASHPAVVDLLYTNVVGSPPPDADRDYYVGLLDRGEYSVAGLGMLAADIDINLNNIDLVGLSQRGLEFIPYSEG